MRFLFSEGVKPIEIHRRTIIQYGDRCMSRTQVYEWTEKFKNGVSIVETRRDDDEVRSALHEWLRARQKEFFPRGIYALAKRWRKCIELEGAYVEQ